MSRNAGRALLSAALILGGGLVAGWFAAAAMAVVSLPMLIRTSDGRLWGTALLTRLRFRIARARGLTSYFGDPGLPGVLSGVRLVQEYPFAIAEQIEPVQRYSVVIAKDSSDGQWLRALANLPEQPTVSMTAQGGSGVFGRLDLTPAAGALARCVLMQAAPAEAGLPTAWVTLTWAANGRTAAQMGDAISAWVALLHVGEPLSGPQLSALLSFAFSPERAPVDQWDLAGPGRADEQWNRYEHADSTSLAWRVVSGTPDLQGLLVEDSTSTVTRVSVMLHPEPGGREFRQSSVVTLTCPADPPDALRRAAAAVRRNAAASQVVLAPAAGCMATTFCAGLGVGAVLAKDAP